ncbi:hypothetical protein Fuma_01160 [Fuerstiella marisgermanici]|uniref:Uncharacterized protein n=1 Tax=Fuerstiella marisgermanici TaxID=1891926 RepID=A0A1P8WBX7_9PLAN|nr:hypothetical protein Fuma_01160 [Fuerstiella marisgermanici]
MDDKKDGRSQPDYAAWRAGIHEVSQLPSPRYYFTVTLAALVSIAFFLSWYGAHWSAVFSVAVLILLFGATVFILQWRRDGDGHTSEIRAVESSDQSAGAEEIDEAKEAVRRGEFHGSDTTSVSSVRASLGGEAGGGSDHPKRPR